MKNLVLPALCWALAMSQSFAQKTLPPSVAEYAVNWTYTVKKMLNAAGFELPQTDAPSGAKPVVEARASELQLDSTLTYYDYGLNGNDSLPLLRTTYTYPVTGIQVLIESQYEVDAWKLANRTTLIYDEQERLVETFAQVYDPSVPTWVNDSRLEMFPRGDSPDLLDSVIVSAWNVDLGDWQRLMTISNSYDNLERLSESLTVIDVFGQPLNLKDVYTYDANGDNSLIESFYLESGLEILASSIEMAYENHLVTLETSLVFDGLGMVPESQVTYDYTNSGLAETIEYFEWDTGNADWAKTQTDTYEYDDLQRLEARETRLYFEGLEERYRYTQAYVEDELLFLETSYFFDFNQNQFLVDDKKYYYYSGQVSEAPNQPKPVIALGMYPNPTSGVAQLDLDGEVSVQVFDGVGQLVYSLTEEGGRVNLDLSELPAGVYSIRAFAEDKYYAGRLVKQ